MATTRSGNGNGAGTSAGGAPASTTDNAPWEDFLRARVAAIGWLHQQAHLNDGEIAKAMSMTATEVFLVRARQGRNTSSRDTDSALSQAAPLGDH